MKQKSYKPKVYKRPRRKRTDGMEEKPSSIRMDVALKRRFVKALSVGRRTTITQAIHELMTAYCETTERDGRQPEFPLEVRPKPSKANPET